MRIAVVMGGPSAEYEISIRSGSEIITHLQTLESYSVRVVVVSKDGKFFWCDNSPDHALPLESLMAPESSDYLTGPVSPASSENIWDGCALAFLALHGEFGEDGKIQGFFDTIGLPYTGSSVKASSVAMDKIMTTYLFEQAGLPTAPSVVLHRSMSSQQQLDALKALDWPLFIKCPQSGSSRLMGRVADETECKILCEELFTHSDKLLVEQCIQGDEFSCPVLEYPDGKIEALPPVEIIPRGGSFFDFEAKYSDNACEEIVPVPREPGFLKQIQEFALAAHKLLGCQGISRTDMIYDGRMFYLLEINSLPGMTSHSLVPKSYAAAGGSYPELLEIQIQVALNRSVHV